jgi:ribosomal protein S6
MYNMYEIIFLINPNISVEILKTHVDGFFDMIKKNGKNIFIKIIKKKHLAWSCKKHDFGYLVYHKYIAESNIVKEYEDNLNSLEICLLKQTILIEKKTNYHSCLEMINKKY